MSSEDKQDKAAELDQDALAQLAEAATQITAMLGTMANLHNDQGDKLENFTEALEEVRESLKKMATIVFLGNGRSPIIARLAALESTVEWIQGELKSRQEQSAISKKGKWGLIIAITTGALGLATAIISAIASGV